MAGESSTSYAASRHAVKTRSVIIGLLGVLFICSFTAFNDYVLGNGFLVGNFLPAGLLLFFLILVLLINAPLRKIAPRLALGGGELAVAMGMTLVSCTLPSSGLMRYLPASLIAIPNQAGINPQFGQVVRELNLPQWMFPTFESKDPAARSNEPVITDFLRRVPLENPTFWNRVRSVPWGKWATPALTWGLLMAFVYGSVLCLAAIVRHQWVENERLPFPLASVYVSLIEPPEEGKAVNALFRSNLFWIAAGTVFMLHAINALHEYIPSVPKIPLRFDLSKLFGNDPWRFIDPEFQQSTVYFSVVGICYFLQSKLAFSLWFFFVAIQAVRMIMGTAQGELTHPKQVDQSLGAQFIFALTIVWIGRHQWMTVIRQMFRGAQPSEPRGKYMPYPLAGWGYVLCSIGVGVWLWLAGASAIGAAVLVLSINLLFLGISRIVAETGLIFCHMRWAMDRPWFYGLTEFGHREYRTTIQTFFLSSWLTGIFAYGQRENAAVYATHALKINDEIEPAMPKAWKMTACLALALLVGYVVSGASMLFVEYSWDQRLSHNPAQVNEQGLYSAQQRFVPSTLDYMQPGGGSSRDVHSRLGHFALGATITGLLSFLRLRFAGWPLHPIGYLLVYSYPMQTIWFSVLVGWIFKTLVIRVGGLRVFQEARPLFIGLIIGEAAAAAFWLGVSVVCAAMGIDYYAINFLPG